MKAKKETREISKKQLLIFFIAMIIGAAKYVIVEIYFK
jgi:hypothetical protein